MKQMIWIILLPVVVWGQTVEINRSVGSAGVVWENTGSFSVSSSQITFTSTPPDTFGEGIGIQFDSTGLNLAINAVMFIQGKISNNIWTVKRSNGATAKTISGVTLFNCYYTYTSTGNLHSGNENDNFADLVENFDGGATDLIVANQTWRIALYPILETSWDTDMDSWRSGQVSGSDRLIFYTPTEDQAVTRLRHSGVHTARCYRLEGSVATALILWNGDVTVDHEFDGMIFKNTNGSGMMFSSGDGNANGKTLVVKNSIFIGSNGSSSAYSHSGFSGITTGQNSTATFINCLFYDWSSSAVSNDNAAACKTSGFLTLKIFNCTNWGGDRGFWACGGADSTKYIVVNTITNNVANGFPGPNYISEGNSYSNISSGTFTPGHNRKTSTNVTFANTGSKDFRFVESTTDGKDDGYDNSAAGYDADVAGTSRPQGSGWDRGFHELEQDAQVESMQRWRRRVIR